MDPKFQFAYVGFDAANMSKDAKELKAGVPVTIRRRVVEFEGTPIPKLFQVAFFFQSVGLDKRIYWRVILEIELDEKAIPSTRQVSISGDDFQKNEHGILSEIHPDKAERVNSMHILFVSRELRRLEAEAVVFAIGSFAQYETGEWTVKAIALDAKIVRDVKKDVLNRVSYEKLSPVFLKRISDLYKKAEKAELPVIKFIAEEIGRMENRLIEPRTAENWVRVARAKGHLAPAKPRKSTSTNKSRKKTTKTNEKEKK